MMINKLNKIFGSKGELIAANYLKTQHYKIVETNYKNEIGEIDIIATYNKIIVFVEVKLSNSSRFGRPSERVNIVKQNKIRSVATVYLQKNKKLNDLVRFDVIEILNDNINHIENAF